MPDVSSTRTMQDDYVVQFSSSELANVIAKAARAEAGIPEGVGIVRVDIRRINGESDLHNATVKITAPITGIDK